MAYGKEYEKEALEIKDKIFEVKYMDNS